MDVIYPEIIPDMGTEEVGGQSYDGPLVKQLWQLKVNRRDE